MKFEKFAKVPKGYVRVGKAVTITSRTLTEKGEKAIADGLYQVAVNEQDAHLESAQNRGVSIELSLEAPGMIFRKKSIEKPDGDDFLTVHKHGDQPKGTWRCFLFPFKVWRVKRIRRAA